jgi:hypothetical protein
VERPIEGPSGLLLSMSVVDMSEDASGECCSIGDVSGDATSVCVALRRGVERVTTLGERVGLGGGLRAVVKERRLADVLCVSCGVMGRLECWAAARLACDSMLVRCDASGVMGLLLFRSECWWRERCE